MKGVHSSGVLNGSAWSELMIQRAVPGCSVSILDGGQVVESRGFGVLSPGKDRVSPHTPFQACSVSKPVAVLAALRLVDAGRLNLDDDINELLTSWKLPPADAGSAVTLRQLASHTAGLNVHGFAGYAAGAQVPTLLEILSGISPANSPAVRVELAPGTQFNYSGGGTTVMQLLLEETTGRQVSELIKDLVLAPLGMNDSTFEQPIPGHLALRAAEGHDTDGNRIVGGWHTYPEQCAAGLWTTPSDLLKFAVGVQNALAGNSDSLLSAAMSNEMLRPQMALPEDANAVGPRFNAIGLGLFLSARRGASTWFGHGGANEGFRCHLVASCRTGQGAAIMTNSDGGSALFAPILEAVCAAYRWGSVECG